MGGDGDADRCHRVTSSDGQDPVQVAIADTAAGSTGAIHLGMGQVDGEKLGHAIAELRRPERSAQEARRKTAATHDQPGKSVAQTKPEQVRRGPALISRAGGRGFWRFCARPVGKSLASGSELQTRSPAVCARSPVPANRADSFGDGQGGWAMATRQPALGGFGHGQRVAKLSRGWGKNYPAPGAGCLGGRSGPHHVGQQRQPGMGCVRDPFPKWGMPSVVNW